MAVVEPTQTGVPDRLLIALLHVGAAPKTLVQRYGISADRLIALKGRPTEPLRPEDLEHVPEDGCQYELWRGELIRMLPSQIRHGTDAGQLAIKLGAYLEVHPIGRLLVAEPGFRVGPANSVICPDLAFIHNDRMGLFPPTSSVPFLPTWPSKSSPRAIPASGSATRWPPT
jgi:hypothetical protein